MSADIHQLPSARGTGAGCPQTPPPAPAFIDCAEWLQREPAPRLSTFEKIAGALGGERMFPLYLAFWSGSMFTLAMAMLWARVLS